MTRVKYSARSGVVFEGEKRLGSRQEQIDLVNRDGK